MVKKRRYKLTLRFIDKNRSFISEGKDVSEASDKLERKIGIKGAEFGAIIDNVKIWNPKTNRWVKHKPWWEEEKEKYPWEKGEK